MLRVSVINAIISRARTRPGWYFETVAIPLEEIDGRVYFSPVPPQEVVRQHHGPTLRRPSRFSRIIFARSGTIRIVPCRLRIHVRVLYCFCFITVYRTETICNGGRAVSRRFRVPGVSYYNRPQSRNSPKIRVKLSPSSSASGTSFPLGTRVIFISPATRQTIGFVT